MKQKKCSKCGVLKPLTEYHKQKTGKFGVKARCKTCRCELKKQYREANKEKINAQNREYYEANKEKIKVRTRQYEKENREKRNKSRRKRRKEDIAYRLRDNVSSAVSHALKRSKGSKQGESTFKHLPYTPEALKEHIESQFDDKMTWKNYGSYWHIDHIYPQSLLPYDSLEHENFKKAWALSNLRPLEATENIKKSNKVIE